VTAIGAEVAMTGVYLPGGRRVEVREVPRPTPGHGQVLVRMRASTICGSDLRAIYREHLGSGPEAYRDVIAGHEPCGEIVETGPGCRRQRDGGHADYLVAEESTCVGLTPELSFVDGACIACGFGTAYEALCRARVSGRDTVLITGLGPVGLAAGLLARALGATTVVGADVVGARLDLASDLGAVTDAFVATDTSAAASRVAGGAGCEVSIDCSGSAAGRAIALAGTRNWGRCLLVGEGGRLEIDVSTTLIHRQISVAGWRNWSSASCVGDCIPSASSAIASH